jgi:hypothetical protein
MAVVLITGNFTVYIFPTMAHNDYVMKTNTLTNFRQDTVKLARYKELHATDYNLRSKEQTGELNQFEAATEDARWIELEASFRGNFAKTRVKLALTTYDVEYTNEAGEMVTYSKYNGCKLTLGNTNITLMEQSYYYDAEKMLQMVLLGMEIGPK